METALIAKFARGVRGGLRRCGMDVVRYRPRPPRLADVDRYSYQSRLLAFDIPPSSVVLDVGSGHYPFRPATILADRHMRESPDRTESLIVDDRPFVVLDMKDLPFQDKTVDFIYCSHVLEHLDDPVRACQEMQRVAHRGYIETPNYASDLLFDWADRVNHKWHAVSIGNRLVFCEYSQRQKRGVGSSAWYDLIRGKAYHPVQDLYYNNLELFNVMFLWDHEFECIAYRLGE